MTDMYETKTLNISAIRFTTPEKTKQVVNGMFVIINRAHSL